MVTKIAFEQPPVEQSETGDPSSRVLRKEIWTPTTGGLGPSLPNELLLGTLRDGRLRVHSPIPVKLEKEGEDIVAEAVEFNEFGFGKNPAEALADLQRAIAELYFTLEKDQNRLGPDLESVWAKVQGKIRAQKK